MSPRTFQVMEPLGDSPGAHLRFRGRWILAAGFKPGDTFVLSNPSPGKLVLEVTSPAPMTGEDFLMAVAPFDKIGL